MYCPNCRSEYRQGITTCADCQAELVAELPAKHREEQGAIGAGPSDAGMVSLWDGDDPSVFTELSQALDHAGIRFENLRQVGYKDMSPGGFQRIFPTKASGLLRYDVCVLSSDLDRAGAILESVLSREMDASPSAAEDEDGEAPEQPSRPVLQQSSGKCDSLAWSGEDENLANFLEAALKVNEIDTRLERFPQGTATNLWVQAENLPRAREIVREVTEGRSPE